MPTFELSANGKTFEIDAPDQGAAVGAFQKMNGGAAPAAPQPSITDAVTDIPAEIGRTAGANLDTIKAGITDRGSKGPIEGLMSTGKALMAIPGLIASPITGAARSLIGHPMAQAEHAVGTLINPEVAAKDDPQKMYQTAAGDVETALSAARPAGAPVRAPASMSPPRTVQTGAGQTTIQTGQRGPFEIPANQPSYQWQTPQGDVPPAPVPTVPELKAAARAGYNDPAVAAVKVRPQPVANLSTQIENELAKRGFRNRPNQGGAVFEEIRDLVPPQGVASVRVADLHSSRKALGQIEKERDTVGQPTSNSAAATIAKRHLDKFLPNIQQADVLAGDAAQASTIMREADANWGAAKRAESVDLQLTRADRQAAKSGMGGNIENAMRQKISVLLDNPKRTIGFSAPERQAMEDIVRGTRTRNTLRNAGKMGVDGGLSMQLGAAAALGSGGTTIPVTAMGTIARMLGQRATARAGARLSEMVRSRSTLGRGNIGTNAVQQALNPPRPNTRAAIPYSAIVSALMQPQNQRVR